jgi:5-(carboxyamino)imidazole ribonucleotide synthase
MSPNPLPPGSTIGIFGGGQLGRLLAMAAAKLGLKTAVFAPEEDSPAFQAASRSWVSSYDDEAAVLEFARACDAVTFEFENVPAQTLRLAARHALVRPGPRAAEVTQNRIAERQFLLELGLPVAPHIIIETAADLANAAAFLSTSGPALLKRAREGYDGKGQRRISDAAGLEAAFVEFAAPCVLESIVGFASEISVIGVRTEDGRFLSYDCPENVHGGGILRTSTVPARCPPQAQALARSMAERIGSALDYCGVFAVEFFAMPEGSAEPVLINEIAPRVHNSGHWTLDACTISQFENHIRAVAGWPPGSVERHSDAVMTNLLGQDVLDWGRLLASDPAASLYLYGKADIRKGRKLGHVTRISPIKKI